MITLQGVRLARAPEQLVDIVIEAERIASITPAGAPTDTGAATVVEGDGRLACAGFIDAHVHGEAAVFDEDIQLALLRQGITSVVLGQDGVSFAPTQTGLKLSDGRAIISPPSTAPTRTFGAVPWPNCSPPTVI